MRFVVGNFKIGIGQHFRIYANIKTKQHPEGEQVMRKYTPISRCCENIFQLLIKIYRKGVHPQFPEGGKLTPYLQHLQLGDQVDVQGPFGKFKYLAPNTITIDDQPIIKNKIFFIAGGTGITPIYQVIREVAHMTQDKTQMILLFANKTQQDMILRKELTALQPRVKVHYILDNAPEGWKGYSGWVTKDILNQICTLDQPNTLYCHCGPTPMNKLIREIFKQYYPNSHLFKF